MQSLQQVKSRQTIKSKAQISSGPHTKDLFEGFLKLQDVYKVLELAFSIKSPVIKLDLFSLVLGFPLFFLPAFPSISICLLSFLLLHFYFFLFETDLII